MADFYKATIPIFDPDVPVDFSALNPDGVSYGYVERDYAQYPQEMFQSPSEMDIIPESEWDAWYDMQEEKQSSLEHIFLQDGQPAFVNLDQNGHGYCWAYSGGHATMMRRLASGQPLVRLNPHSVAAIIKRGRDEGGWCGLAAQFIREHGIAEEGTGPGQWPLHSRTLANDTAACRASMAKYKTLESWVDLTRSVYDQNLTRAQLASCLFKNDPCQTDFNWWGHSVCGIRWVRVERGSWGLLILNSWKGWGRFGLAVLRGSKAIPNGSLAIRSVVAA